MMVFIKAAAKYGFKPIKSTGKHLKFVNSAGTKIGAPKTSSDFRSIKNFESQARRAAGGATTTPNVSTPSPANAGTVQPKATTPTPKQRYEAGEKGLKTGNQTTFKDFMQKVDTARTKAPKPAASAPSTAQRMAQGYDQNIAPVINRRGREVLSSIQRRERLVNKFGKVNEGAALAIKAGSSLIPKIMTGIGAVGTLMQATRAEKDAANERRRQLAKEHGLDPTKPGDRAKLGRLMKQTGDAKGRASKGDTRSPEQYRKDKAEDNKIIDAARKSLGQSKAKVGTKERTKIDKELKDFRDELRDVKPEPSTRAKVRVKVGQEVPKPDTTQPPRTGASPQKVRDRRSYEAQQRRNRKRDAAQDIPEGMLPVPSDKRKRIINPMIAAMPPKTDKGINDAMKKGLDGLNDKYQKLYDKLNSVPKDRGKA